jgi:YjbE family integral membrane protein
VDEIILFLQIILINMVLSGDNAVVIAMASKNLPLEQRTKAIWWGSLGAVFLRLILTAAAVYLLSIPYIQAVGAVLLLYIAIKLLLDEKGHEVSREVYSFSAVVWTIIAADFVMSLDNVLAIAAIAQGNIAILILGIALSLPLIIWGSTLIMRLLQEYPVLVFLGAAILGYTAGEMFIHEPKVIEVFRDTHSSFHWFIPVFFTCIVVTTGIMNKTFFSSAHKR